MSCNCISGNKNTGVEKCIEALKHQTGLLLMHRFGSNGELNHIPLVGGVVTEAAILALLQAPDKLDRIYPIGNGDINKNIEINNGDDQTESYTDGTTAVTVDGNMILENMFIKNMSPAYLGKLKSFKCSEMMAFVIDKDGTLVGQILTGKDANNLYPKTINMDTWAPKWQASTPTRLAGNLLSFEFSSIDIEENIRWIDAEVIETNLNTSGGLFDVILTAVVTSSTVTTVTAKDCFGFPAGPALGLSDVTDWNFVDNAGVPLVLDTVSDDNAEGIYICGHPDATGLYPLNISSGLTAYQKNYELTPLVVPTP